MDIIEPRKAWEKFQDRLKIAEATWIALAPWIIGLDAVVIGSLLSRALDFQALPLKFKMPLGIGMVLLMISFISGIYYKTKETDLRMKELREASDQYLVQVGRARNSSDLLFETEESKGFLRLADAAKIIEALQDDLGKSRGACVIDTHIINVLFGA